MLESIKLKDYTTFIKETIFDFKATNYKILNETNVKDKILKGALFVGENASGKTQTLKAIVFLLDLVLGNSEITFLDKKSLYTKGTQFSLEYIFVVDNCKIKYEVEFLNNKINLEKLFLDDKIMIDRLKDGAKIYFGAEGRNVDIDSQLSILKQEYYKTKFEGHKVLNKWFLFLKNSVYFNCLTSKIRYYNQDIAKDLILEKYLESEEALKLNEFIKDFGYNSEIVKKEVFSNVDSNYNLVTSYSIGIRKNNTDVDIPLILESTGNKIFMRIILPMLYVTKNDGMIIIDEFSSGLHNELEESLIRYFFDNSKKSQMFFTTQSTNILDTSILRPDQVYTFSFNSSEGTIIKRFSDENPRESQNLEKMYLAGVFNGKPIYSKKFKN